MALRPLTEWPKFDATGWLFLRTCSRDLLSSDKIESSLSEGTIDCILLLNMPLLRDLFALSMSEMMGVKKPGAVICKLAWLNSPL